VGLREMTPVKPYDHGIKTLVGRGLLLGS